MTTDPEPMDDRRAPKERRMMDSVSTATLAGKEVWITRTRVYDANDRIGPPIRIDWDISFRYGGTLARGSDAPNSGSSGHARLRELQREYRRTKVVPEPLSD